MKRAVVLLSILHSIKGRCVPKESNNDMKCFKLERKEDCYKHLDTCKWEEKEEKKEHYPKLEEKEEKKEHYPKLEEKEEKECRVPCCQNCLKFNDHPLACMFNSMAYPLNNKEPTGECMGFKPIETYLREKNKEAIQKEPWRSEPFPDHCQMTAVHNIIQNSMEAPLDLSTYLTLNKAPDGIHKYNGWDRIASAIYSLQKYESKLPSLQLFVPDKGGEYTDTFVQWMLKFLANYQLEKGTMNPIINNIAEAENPWVGRRYTITPKEFMSFLTTGFSDKDIITNKKPVVAFMIEVRVGVDDAIKKKEENGKRIESSDSDHSTVLLRNTRNGHYYYLDSNEHDMVEYEEKQAPEDRLSRKYFNPSKDLAYCAEKNIDFGKNAEAVLKWFQNKINTQKKTEGGAIGFYFVTKQDPFSDRILLDSSYRKSLGAVSYVYKKDKAHFRIMNTEECDDKEFMKNKEQFEKDNQELNKKEEEFQELKKQKEQWQQKEEELNKKEEELKQLQQKELIEKEKELEAQKDEILRQKKDFGPKEQTLKELRETLNHRKEILYPCLKNIYDQYGKKIDHWKQGGKKVTDKVKEMLMTRPEMFTTTNDKKKGKSKSNAVKHKSENKKQQPLNMNINNEMKEKDNRKSKSKGKSKSKSKKKRTVAELWEEWRRDVNKKKIKPAKKLEFRMQFSNWCLDKETQPSVGEVNALIEADIKERDQASISVFDYDNDYYYGYYDGTHYSSSWWIIVSLCIGLLCCCVGIFAGSAVTSAIACIWVWIPNVFRFKTETEEKGMMCIEDDSV